MECPVGIAESPSWESELCDWFARLREQPYLRSSITLKVRAVCIRLHQERRRSRPEVVFIDWRVDLENDRARARVGQAHHDKALSESHRRASDNRQQDHEKNGYASATHLVIVV